jgi:chromosome segregation ATPase
MNDNDNSEIRAFDSGYKEGQKDTEEKFKEDYSQKINDYDVRTIKAMIKTLRNRLSDYKNKIQRIENKIDIINSKLDELKIQESNSEEVTD